MMALDNNARIEVEEQLMISRYGDQYRQYMSRTGRNFPKF
jgi:protein-S-isoprenylcysteine O-methyltransferase Ste14